MGEPDLTVLLFRLAVIFTGWNRGAPVIGISMYSSRIGSDSP